MSLDNIRISHFLLWIQSFSSQTFRETSWTRQTPASCSREHSKQAYSGLLFQEEHSYIGKLWPYLTLASFCWDMKQRSLLDPSWKKDPAETTGITLKLVIGNRNNWTRTQAWELLSNCRMHSILHQFWFWKFLFQPQKPYLRTDLDCCKTKLWVDAINFLLMTQFKNKYFKIIHGILHRKSGKIRSNQSYWQLCWRLLWTI